ncbi:hypothetical protein CS006_10430 [Bifidobacterium primatium]|uniref:Uncharacterized protein n=1 Tax=Bifidobacterium primatium TaxID=2045438 RepID=A0A2M9H697_9BIFI|nr:hypothetical protein [Bifidobacterium primatium]PJM72344.1 hypothetical protein CS006_10430 [Bifidobacterium primatium]
MADLNNLPDSRDLRKLLEQAQKDYQANLDNLTDAATDDIETAIQRGDLDIHELVDEYARDASQMANEYYDQLRGLWAEQSSEPMPDFTHDKLVDPSRTLWQVQHGFSNTDFNGLTYKQVMEGRSRAGMTIDDLWPDLSDVDDAQQFIADMIAASGRLTMQRNIRLDPTKPRWARVCGSATPCAFCVMLASRGFEYSSQETADFGPGFHDGHCHCSVVPSWGKNSILLDRQAEWKNMYQTAQGISSADAYDGDALSAMRRIFAGTLKDGTPLGLSVDSDLYKSLKPEDVAGILQLLADTKHVKTARLWADHANRYRIVDEHNGGTPNFNHAKGGISLDIDHLTDAPDGHAPYQTFFHETGHMLDWIKGNGRLYYSQTYRDKNGNGFKALLQQDGDNALESARKKAWPDIQRQLESIRNEVDKRGYAEGRYLHRLADLGLIKHSEIVKYMGMKEYRDTVLHAIDDALFEEHVDDKIAMKALADEIHAQGKGTDFDVDDILEFALKDRWHPYSLMKHEVGYFRNHSVETEAFAEMLSGHLANENTWRLFVSYFPKSYRMFQDMIRSMAS